MNAEERGLITRALQLISACLWHCTIGKEDYNCVDLGELDEIITQLREWERRDK